MENYIIDAHIHLDLYDKDDRLGMLNSLEEHYIHSVIAVSNHLSSAKNTLQIAMQNDRVLPAFGYHPEQQLPSKESLIQLFTFICEHQHRMVAIGEVGLPYYLRRADRKLEIEPYIELLEQFIKLASELDKPIILHAIYDDAPVVCDLLEKYSCNKAHFHWFKGDDSTLIRMRENGYYISITPEVLYKKEIREIVKKYPLTQMMVETDGPWPYTGPFKSRMTQPKMLHSVIKEISAIKEIDVASVYKETFQNTTNIFSAWHPNNSE